MRLYLPVRVEIGARGSRKKPLNWWPTYDMVLRRWDGIGRTIDFSLGCSTLWRGFFENHRKRSKLSP
jgi:hypothetical protein